MGIYEELVERGLIAQTTDEAQIRDLVNNGKATFYIGFDCTADSLTAGPKEQLMIQDYQLANKHSTMQVTLLAHSLYSISQLT